MRILYLHGLGSGPNAYKAALLRERGHDVTTPALDNDDFDRSVQQATEALVVAQPDVIVGSSRGGAVAVNLTGHRVPMVLIAPAWKRPGWGTASRVPKNTLILHSPDDDVVPIAWSRQLAVESELPESALIEIGAGHTMTDEAALAALFEAVEILAEGH